MRRLFDESPDVYFLHGSRVQPMLALVVGDTTERLFIHTRGLHPAGARPLAARDPDGQDEHGQDGVRRGALRTRLHRRDPRAAIGLNTYLMLQTRF